ncbi:MAG: hypothetical protein MUD01_05435 [Chloroflexaceae bacterium]|jgi:hypothetical protein|nr:hypothetical protein [Chloroflexaceae bacterium]
MSETSKKTRLAADTHSDGQQEIVAADTTSAAVQVHGEQTALAATAVLGAGVQNVSPEDISRQAIPSAAYGDFVRQVGLAVADAQKALDTNSVNAAKELANTTVPALIALNQVINEDGEIEKVEPVIQQDARLIQYIQPTFYQFRTVQMFAKFDVSDFQSDGTTKISSSRSNFGFNSRFNAASGLNALFGGINGGFNQTFNTSSSNTEINSEFESASSRGTSYMYADLRPRTDTRFPPPIVATQGPRLTMSAAANALTAPEGDTAETEMDITVTIFKKGGFSNANNKSVDLVLNGPGLLTASTVALAAVANDPQRLSGTVKLKRRKADASGTATIRATLGGLTAVVTIDFPAPPPA